MRRLGRTGKSKLNHQLSIAARQFAAVIFCFIFAVPQAALARTPQSSLSPAPKVTKQGKTLTHVVENRDDLGKVKTRISATGRLTEIKIDSHSSGTASSWEVTSGQTTVRASAPYRGQFSKIEVLKHKPKGILAMQMRLTADRRKYVVMSSDMRPYGKDFSQLTFSNLNTAPVCEDNNSPRELASVFADAVSNDVQSLEAQWACQLKKRQWLFLDKSCERFSIDDREKMMEGLAKVFASPATRAASPKRALACMEDLGLPEHSARIQAILLQNWNQAEQALANAGQNTDSGDCTAIPNIGGQSAVDVALPNGRMISCERDAADLNAQGEYIQATGQIVLKRNAIDLLTASGIRSKELFGYGPREAYASTIFHELVHASGFNSANASVEHGVSESVAEGVEKCCTEPTYGESHSEAAASCARVQQFVADARSSGLTPTERMTDPVLPEYRRYEEMFSRLMHTSGRHANAYNEENGVTDYLLVKSQVAHAYQPPEVGAQLLNTYFATLALNQEMFENEFRTCVASLRTSLAEREYQCTGTLSGRIRALNQHFFTRQCPNILSGHVPASGVRASCNQWIAGFNVMSDPNDVARAPGYGHSERVGYRVIAGYYGGRSNIPSFDEVRTRRTWTDDSKNVVRGYDAAEQFGSDAMRWRTADVRTTGIRLAEIDRRFAVEAPAIPAPQIEVAQLAPLPPVSAQAEVITPPAPRIAVAPLQIEQRIVPVQAQREVLQPATVSEIITPMEVDQRLTVVQGTAPRVVSPAPAPAPAPAVEAETGGSLVFGSAAAVAPRPSAAAAREVAPPPARSEVLVRSSDFDSPITMRESDLGSRAPSVSRGRYEPAASTERATAPVQALLSFADRVAQAALPQAQAQANPQFAAMGTSGGTRAPANSFDNPFAENPSAPAQAAAPVAAASGNASASLAPVVQDSNIGDLTRSNFSAARTQGAKPATSGKSAPASASAASAASRNAQASRAGAQPSRENQEEDAPRRGGSSPDAPARAVSGVPVKGAAAQKPEEDVDPQASSGRGPARAGAPAARAARPRVYANEDSLRSFLQSPDYSRVSSSLSTTALGVALIDYNYRITNEAGVTYGSQARDAKVLVYCHAQRRLMAPGACR